MLVTNYFVQGVADRFGERMTTLANQTGLSCLANRIIGAVQSALSMDDLSYQGTEFITDILQKIIKYPMQWTVVIDTSSLYDWYTTSKHTFDSISVKDIPQYIMETITRKIRQSKIYQTVAGIYDTSHGLSTSLIETITTNTRLNQARLYVVEAFIKTINAIKNTGITGHLLIDTPLLLVLAFYVYLTKVVFVTAYWVYRIIKNGVHVVLHLSLMGLSMMALPVLLLRN